VALPVAISGKHPIGTFTPRRACSPATLATEASGAVRVALLICMKRIALVAASLACLSDPCAAQFFQWADDVLATRPGRGYERPPRPADPPRRQRDKAQKKPAAAAAIADGGPRPEIKPHVPPVVAFPHSFVPASVVIDTSARKLYYVLRGSRAYAYSISVGREGFTWTGNEAISRKQPWPDWYPPEEMRQRDPKLPEKMTGGVRNPLGALALYLGTTLYRIHGTNDAKSIGRAQSSGCFRMMNSAVLHLGSLVDVGTRVEVVRSLLAGPREAPRS